MSTEIRTVGYYLVGLLGVVLFMIGASLVIWVLHILMWNSPSSDIANHLPSEMAALYVIAQPLGLFLVGFSMLLIVWSGFRLAVLSYIASTQLDDKSTSTHTGVSVEAHCPHCNAVYVYRFPDIESDYTVTCQNCSFQFKAVPEFDNTNATE